MPSQNDGNYETDMSKRMTSPQVVPVSFTASYTEDDIAKVQHIIEWLNKTNNSSSWLATASNTNRSTLHQLLKGTYTGRNGQLLKPVVDTIRHLDARENVRTSPFVTTTVSRMVFTACSRARKLQTFAVVAANVGTGKTRSLKEYTADNANTFFIEASPMMSPGALLDDLIDQLCVRSMATKVTREGKFQLVRNQLYKIKNPLIILDEADTVNPQALHNLRRLRDMSQVGVVFAGTNKLYQIIAPVGGTFDQIRSRACFFPQPIREITKEDAVAILASSFEDRKEAFDDDGQMHKQLISAFWYYSKGSARVLVEGLIPALRDYGLPQHGALTADVIHAVAKDVLSLG